MTDLPGHEPVDGVLVVLSSNQLNRATFAHQMGDVYVAHLVNKSGNIYNLIIFSEYLCHPLCYLHILHCNEHKYMLFLQFDKKKRCNTLLTEFLPLFDYCDTIYGATDYLTLSKLQ